MECSTKFALDTYGQATALKSALWQENGPQHGRVARTLNAYDGETLHRFLRGAHASVRNSSPHDVVEMDGQRKNLADEYVAHLAHQSDLRRGRVPLRRGYEATI